MSVCWVCARFPERKYVLCLRSADSLATLHIRALVPRAAGTTVRAQKSSGGAGAGAGARARPGPAPGPHYDWIGLD